MEHVDDLLALARTETGLEDFGEDTFREGLERLVGNARDPGRHHELRRRVERREEALDDEVV